MKTLSLICILVIGIVGACDSGNVEDLTIHVYKTKQDYSSLVPVQLSPDGKLITSAPGKCAPLRKLAQGYFLGNTMGINTAYLSLSIEEYNSYDPILGVDSLYKYIMEKDPFLEYYISEDNELRNEDGIDTAFINYLIMENNLAMYFTQLK